MQVHHTHCAGLDVHKDTVVACARIAPSDGPVTQEHETFDTTTPGLCALADWLTDRGITHAVMEATGVYWKPVWHVLEESLDLTLANAAQVKNLPGRKTDINDATWLADLFAHGLIRGSFVPPDPIQELRWLMRTRKQLVRERAQHVQRLQKTLEDANIKLASVASDITGVSGRAVLEALARGEKDPQKLADLTQGRLKAPRHKIVEALHGYVLDRHRFLVKLHLQQVDALDQAIDQVEAEAGRATEPFRAKAELLTTMPGVSQIVAQTIVAEIGVDMTRFPTAGHLTSWAGLCPRSDKSAGKSRSTRVMKGAPWLKVVLVQAAWAAVRVKDTYLRDRYYKIRKRRGPKKAIIAVASTMLTSAYHMILKDEPYRELGPDHVDQQQQQRTANRMLKKLRSMGFDVEIKEAATAA